MTLTKTEGENVILPTSKKMVQRRIGFMKRLEAKDLPFVGRLVSPSIQGTNAWKLLSAKQKGQVNAALDDASTNPTSKYYGTPRRDLQWRMDKFGAIHIRKVSRIKVN